MSSRNPNEKLDLQIPEDCRDLLFGPRVDETQRKIMSLDVLQYHSQRFQQAVLLFSTVRLY